MEFNYEGSVHLITGPMSAGKTSELIRRIERYEIADRKCVVIKYINDTRYSENEIFTHRGASKEAIAAKLLFSVFEENKQKFLESDVIGIDEGQFFPDLLEFCEEMANLGKTVIVSALDGDYKREPFDVVAKVIPKAKEITKLTAICIFCKDEAIYSKRLFQSDKLEEIGGLDKYKAVCRKCYFTDKK